MNKTEARETCGTGRRQLLDCTLRDGGYVNSWRFGRETIRSIVTDLVEAGVDFIEAGFLDERVHFDPDRTILPDTGSFDRILEGIDLKETKMLAMIDYGTCGIDRVAPCGESVLDGIRVMFRKHLRREAVEFCRQLKQLGYLVFLQPVSVTGYGEEEMADLIRLANDLQPEAIFVVDTYGLLHQNNLSGYIDLMDAEVHQRTGIGYHGHNNFQMGYANCISVLGRDTSRDICVDGSLYGMGKSAGNAPTELIAMYMKDYCGRAFDVGHILNAIETAVLPFYRTPPWGYNMLYFLAASNGCHPNYVQYYLDTKKLSIRAIHDLLSGMSEEKKLVFDEEYAQQQDLAFRENR